MNGKEARKVNADRGARSAERGVKGGLARSPQASARPAPPPTSDGEREFLVGLVRYARVAKQSARSDVARAARRWEGALVFRIKVGMQRKRRRATTKHTNDTKDLNHG